MLTAYRRFKKNTPLRRIATPAMVRAVKRVETAAMSVIRSATPVEHRSRHRAIAHVGLQKTGTVWFREMLSDPLLYRYSGLHFRDHAGRRAGIDLADGGIHAPIREVSDEVVAQLLRPGTATLFVLRDPRALVLSWLNSTERYHVTGRGDAGMGERRQALRARDLPGKVDYALAYFARERRFEKLERLLALSEEAPGLLVARYEDCTATPDPAFARIFAHFDIALPDDLRRRFIRTHSFEAYAGRRMGEAAAAGSALQGQTQAAIAALPPQVHKRILDAAGPRLAALYEAG